MYKNLNKRLVILMSFVYFISAKISFAQPTETGSTRLTNPIEANSIQQLLAAILEIVVRIGIPIVTLAIIYAGFKFVTARGNPTKIEEAKTTLLYVVIGAAVILGAEVLKDVIQTTATDLLS